MNKLSFSWEQIKKVLEAPSIPNYEGAVFEIIKDILGPKVPVKIEKGMAVVEFPSSLGFSGQVPQRSPTVVLGAHADVLGSRVTEITSEGFLRFAVTGRSHAGWLTGQQVRIVREMASNEVISNKEEGGVVGVIGHKALHHLETEEINKVPKINELFIDVGAKSKAEVKKLDIEVGDPVIYLIEARTLALNGRVVCRGWDNRAGVLTLMEVVRRLSKSKVNGQRLKVVVAFWGGEEVGLLGAFKGSDTFHPDYMINVDVGFATKTPATDKEKSIHGDVDLGEGVIINRGGVFDPTLVKKAYEISQKKKIKTQFSVVTREPGTDATPFNRTATRVLDLGIPCRYMHYDEVADPTDIASAANLIFEILKTL